MQVLAIALLASGVRPAPAPAPLFGINLTRGGLKNHGTNKVLVGAGLAGLGLLTNNRGITNLGTQTVGLGAGTLVASHFFPQGR